jgi:glycosyltransferase involved in cell wall biosynthesis
MRILYAALDQIVPGTLGGSVHVQAVAEGLAALGHEMHVAVTPGSNAPVPREDEGAGGSITWHAMMPPLGLPALRWARQGRVAELARRVRAEAVIERYYNFGGEGILAGRALRLPTVLEVNAPIVDYPGSRKRTLDRLLLIEPMRRWREHICRQVDLFVTPARAILPEWVEAARVLEIEWGADTKRFRPDAPAPTAFAKQPGQIYCVFAGAFRAWHGAVRLTEAIARLHASGERRLSAVLIGDGPERAAAEHAAAGVPGVIFTGARPHAELPGWLAAADIGVAPFDVSRHPPLQLGFYWSPLKIFEYMASGLPVVTPRLPRLEQLVRHDREGLLYDPQEPGGLERALIALADQSLRERLGAAARERAVAAFSWQAHCAKLDERLRGLVAA